MVLDYSAFGGKTSVGLVIDKDEFNSSSGTPEQIFQHWVDDSAAVKQRMANARLVNTVQPLRTQLLQSPPCLKPAASRGRRRGVYGPDFSAGVFLAMWSGKLAAETVLELSKAAGPADASLPVTRNASGRGLTFYWRVVENYYTTPFMELFLQPRDHSTSRPP